MCSAQNAPTTGGANGHRRDIRAGYRYTSAGTVTIRPFAFERLPRVSRHQVRLGQWARARLPRHGQEVARIALSRLLDLEPAWHWDAPMRESYTASGNVGLRLAHTNGARSVAACPRGWAQALVERSLGGPWPPVATPPTPLDPLTAGALLYLAARVLAGTEGALQVVDVLDSDRAIAATLPGEDLLRWPFSLRLGDITLRIDWWLPIDRVPNPRAPAAGHLPPLQLPLFVCAGESRLRASEVGDLGAGDLVVCDWCSVQPHATSVSGEAQLRLGGTPVRGVRLRCHEGSLHVIREQVMADEPETTPTRTGRLESSAVPHDTTERVLAMAGDAPVTLQLELARFQLTLEELAALQTGDVVNCQVPVGERVTLRAGERAIAVGELVDIDGELGVRVTSLLR